MAFQTNNNTTPKRPFLMLVTDDDRLADPLPLLGKLPRGSFVLLRARKQETLVALGASVIPAAHKLGLVVLVAGPVRLARMLGADGAHLNEAVIKRRATSDIWPSGSYKNFILSASAHGRAGLVRAKKAGADFAILGLVFASKSHPDKMALGPIRFLLLARLSPLAVVGIGGIGKTNKRRLLGANGRNANVVGVGAIEMFLD